MLKKLDALRVKALGNPLTVALLMAPFFKPIGVVWASGAVDWLYVIWKGLAGLLIAGMFLSRPRVSVVTVLLGIYQWLLLVSTAANNGDFAGWLYGAVSVGLFCLLMELGLGTSPRALTGGMFYLLGVLVAVNLVTVLAFSSGIEIYNVYFLGTDNANALFIIPLLGLTALYGNSARWPWPVQLCLLAFFSASVYITWSATAVVTVSCFIVLFLLGRAKKCRRFLHVGVFFGVIGAVFLLVVVFRVTDRFAFVLERLLHKDVTLTGRLAVWDTAWGYIARRPFIGYGQMTSGAAMKMLSVYHCHDLFLQALFETGVGGLAVYLAILALLIKPLMGVRSRLGGYMLAATLFCLLLDLVVESPIYPLPFYGLLLLCYRGREVTAALEPPKEK